MVVFDLDGTLLDTRDDIKMATIETRAEFQLPPVSEDQLSEWFGKHPRLFFAGLNSTGVETAILKFRSKLMSSTREPKPFADSYVTLRSLKSRGHVVAVATTKPTFLATSLLKQTPLYQFLDFVQGTDDFAEKPDPEVFLRLEAAIKRSDGKVSDLGISKKISVGDRVSDIQAGLAAGYISFGIKRIHNYETDEEFVAAGATNMLASLEQLIYLEFED